MTLSLIAAIGKNNELGKDNNLIWRFKDDMKFFKDMTMGHKVIMGRKTFESLPKLLEGRKHLVLTRSNLEFPNEVQVFKSIKEFLDLYQNIDEEIFDIGGATIYKELLEYADKLYLTEIEDEDKCADAYFPKFDKRNFEKKELATYEDRGISYKHVLYKRKTYGKR